MLLAEIYGALSGIAHAMMSWRLTVRKSTEPAPGQTVDVFVPTYNESIDIVWRTLSAAVKMDYPHQTWLLDDGNRPEFKKMADELGAHYIARPSHEHAKAGNLNYALGKSTGDFIAIFDADHVPGRNFITAVLGYFSNSNVAFVQTPQDFYNLDSYQHRLSHNKNTIWTEQSLFFKIIQRGKDYWNAAFFCGSCAMVRRSSLNSIGGFATETITEDLHTSIKLHKKGYQSIYHAESLAFGMAPATLSPFITQRIRWGQGAMRVWRLEGLFFSKGLTIAQKINYAASILTYFDGWQKGFFYFAPMIVLCTGLLPIYASATELAFHAIPYFALNFLLASELARGYGNTVFIEQYNMARYFAFAYATLFAIIPGELKFKVTNKELNKELNKNKVSHFLWPQKIVLFANAISIPVGIVMYAYGHLPFWALVISVLCSFINSLLAESVIAFSETKESFKRTSYRFTLPNVVTLELAGKSLFAVVDEISSSGCKIYGSLPSDIGKDSELKGQIYFPGNIFPITIKVENFHHELSTGNQRLSVLGCLFIWESESHMRSLNEHLYESNQQFELADITEKRLTPIEKILLWATSTKRVSQEAPPLKWAPLISNANIPIGVITELPDFYTHCYTAIFSTKTDQTLANLKIIGKDDQHRFNLELISFKELPGSNTSYFICDLKVRP